MCSATSAVETNIVAELGRNPEMSKKLGLEKLSAEEKEEWNRLLTTAYLAGVATGRTNRTVAGAFDAPTNDDAQKKSASRIWFSKADLLQFCLLFSFFKAFFSLKIRGVLKALKKRDLKVLKKRELNK